MTYQPEQPPPHPASAYYPAPIHAASPPKELGVLGVLAFATAALATLFECVDATVVGRAVRHTSTSDDLGTLDWSSAVLAIGSVLAGLALLAGWVTGSMWLYQARKNAQGFNPHAPFVRAAGWAWGGWVCPVVSLWFPFQVVRDTHKAVSPASTSPLIGWWWALFLIMTIGDRVSGRVTANATAEDASGVQGAAIFFALVMVAALACWGLVLRTVTREQHALMYGSAR
jgi:hypothetical protein